MEGTDVCFAPVLSLEEAPSHPHNLARENFVKVDGITQPAPAPRFSRTPGRVHTPPAKPGEHTEEVLEEWGFDKEKISSLKESAVVGRL